MCSAWEFREMTHKRWQLILVAQHIKQTVTFQSCVVTERRSPVSRSNTLWAGVGGATDHGKPTVGRTKVWRCRSLPLRTSTAPIYQALGMVSEYYVIISKGGRLLVEEGDNGKGGKIPCCECLKLLQWNPGLSKWILKCCVVGASTGKHPWKSDR